MGNVAWGDLAYRVYTTALAVLVLTVFASGLVGDQRVLQMTRSGDLESVDQEPEREVVQREPDRPDDEHVHPVGTVVTLHDAEQGEVDDPT